MMGTWLSVNMRFCLQSRKPMRRNELCLPGNRLQYRVAPLPVLAAVPMTFASSERERRASAWRKKQRKSQGLQKTFHGTYSLLGPCIIPLNTRVCLVRGTTISFKSVPFYLPRNRTCIRRMVLGHPTYPLKFIGKHLKRGFVL